MAAIASARQGALTWLLEGTQRAGTKILMSGGTRCNVTHDFVEAADYHGGSRNVVARLLREFSHEDAARFFEEELGVGLKRESTGKLFPETDDAHTVLEGLLGGARKQGVILQLGQKVTAIERLETKAASNTSGSGLGYALTTPAGRLMARRVILTTGGLSYPRTGSDGTGYALAQSLGHSIVPTSPALTPLIASGEMHGRLRGVTLPVELTVRVNGRRFWRGTGSFLFTHFGYSGPVVLDASRHVARERARGPVTLMASFLPGETEEGLEEKIQAEASRGSRRTAQSFLRALLPESVVQELLSQAQVPADRLLAQLGRAERRRLARIITAHELPVIEVMGYRKAEVTAGGVPLQEVDPSTLESRISPGLYLAGEILDVDGRLGGYNFQWAWSTGWVAGKAAAAASRDEARAAV
jgi:predicted Rossmann fold flavoprotein